MAKGNMLQGMARGKVGDVVFSRLNGEQISRVRNRHPKNPRTNGQLYQRAIMATVMQAYSAGKVIFDHAFQGREIGAGNQRRFMALNAKLLRSLIASDINNASALADQKGRVVPPGSMAPVPFAMQISEGTYDNTLTSVVNNLIQFPDNTADEKVSEYVARVGLVKGDIYTIVAFGVNIENTIYTVPGVTEQQSLPYASQRPCVFGYVRLYVKDSAFTSNEDMGLLSDIFDIEVGGSAISTFNPSVGQGIEPTTIFGENYESAAIGCIRSRKDEDLRSTSELYCVGIREWGIASQYILDSWKAGTAALGDSDLILEGGDI